MRRGTQGRTGSGLKPGLVIPPDGRGLVFAHRCREMGSVIVQDRGVSLSHASSSSAADCEDGEGSVGGLRKEEKEIAVLERQRDREEREREKNTGFLGGAKGCVTTNLPVRAVGRVECFSPGMLC